MIKGQQMLPFFHWGVGVQVCLNSRHFIFLAHWRNHASL